LGIENRKPNCLFFFQPATVTKIKIKIYLFSSVRADADAARPRGEEGEGRGGDGGTAFAQMLECVRADAKEGASGQVRGVGGKGGREEQAASAGMGSVRGRLVAFAQTR
jgi:hypothetical protein